MPSRKTIMGNLVLSLSMFTSFTVIYASIMPVVIGERKTSVMYYNVSTQSRSGNYRRLLYVLEAGETKSIGCSMSRRETVIRWDMSYINEGADQTRIIPVYNGRTKTNSDLNGLYDIRLDERNGSWTSVLTLLNVQPPHGGLYACSDASDDIAKMDHIIDVVVSKPHCSANFNDDQSRVHDLELLEVMCNVSYVGNQLPVFRCQPSAVQQPKRLINISFEDHDIGETVVTIKTVTVVYVHVINVNRELEATRLTCSMAFTRGNTSDAEPPTYNFTWNSAPLIVTYGPVLSNLSLDTNILTCIADGNPQPAISWTIDNDKTSVCVGNQLDVCGLDIVKRWIAGELSGNKSNRTGLSCHDEHSSLEIKCSAYGNNRKKSKQTTIDWQIIQQICTVPAPDVTHKALKSHVLDQSTADNNGFLTMAITTSLICILVICGAVIMILVLLVFKRRRRQASDLSIDYAQFSDTANFNVYDYS